MEKEPKIRFKTFKGFPDISDDGQIPTDLFLEASREIVLMIELFGRIFSPVVSDMSGNIGALLRCYEKDTDKYSYLQSLILENKHTASSLLWLKRALELIAAFFHHIMNDGKSSENLSTHLSLAYEATLKPYHGWVTQTAFSIIYRWTPKRSELIGTGPIHDENMKSLEVFLPRMQKHLLVVDAFLKENNLHDNNKV